MSKWHPAGAVALALWVPLSALGASDEELAKIRGEIQELRQGYEARLQALEQRLKEAEARASAAPVASPSPAVAGGGASNAFNPAISAILTGTYAHLKRDPASFHIPGFAPEGEVGPGRRSFGIGESELVFSANVDPYFDGTLIASLAPDEKAGVEEAYGRWLGAPFGLVPKFGRFRSGIGYLNEQHGHAQDFVDAPLAYQAFLGGQFATDGVQVKWVAPTETFVELGGEVGNGDAYPGSDRHRNGAGAMSAFAHAGGDIGESQSWRAGVSWLRTRADEGASRLGIADFVWKFAPQGNARDTYVKVQGEYFTGRIREVARQSGWYLQGVYQFMPQWRVGARYDRLDANGVDDVTRAPKRSSAMVDYNPSEFTRWRLQFARAELAPGETDNQWFVQYTLSLGAHGAHRY